jgi:hypothetical protein
MHIGKHLGLVGDDQGGLQVPAQQGASPDQSADAAAPVNNMMRFQASQQPATPQAPQQAAPDQSGGQPPNQDPNSQPEPPEQTAALGDMSANSISPQDVGHEFWNKTYPKLKESAKHPFLKSLGAMGTGQPGDYKKTNAQGDDEHIRDWTDAGHHHANGLPQQTSKLHPHEKGYVAMMHHTNTLRRGVETAMAEGTARAAFIKKAKGR